MDTLPALEQLSAHDSDALIVALWAEVQRLTMRPLRPPLSLPPSAQ
jgi:hypothetical protein